MSEEVEVKRKRLSEFSPDSHNANKGTQRGRYMLETSVDEVGIGRSLVADRKGRVVAGNKTQEVLIQAGLEDAIVVETDGKRPIIHVRTDWDLDDPDPNNPARRYAYWDNRTSEVGYEVDPEIVRVDLEAGFDFSSMFREFELDELVGDDGSGEVDLGDFLDIPDVGVYYRVIVEGLGLEQANEIAEGIQGAKVEQYRA